MRLPKDRVLCLNLQTSFTDFGRLMDYLRAEQFDGYVTLRGGEDIRWLFLAGGEVTGGLDGTGESGAEVVTAFREQAGQPGQVMTVYRAPGAQMRLLGHSGEVEPMYPPLPSDFVDVGRMMDRLSRDRHTGYVEFAVRDGSTVAYLLMEAGEPVEAILLDGGHTKAGLDVVPAILETVAARGAEISVFRPVRQGADAATTPPEAAESSEADGDTMGETEAAEVAEAWSAIFRAVGEVVDEVAEPGSFEHGLRDALSEHAATYPFFDGGQGRLTYQSGVVRFVAPPPASVSAVLGECLTEAIARISFRSRKVDLEARIQSRLESVAETNRELIQRHGIARAASPFIAA